MRDPRRRAEVTGFSAEPVQWKPGEETVFVVTMPDLVLESRSVRLGDNVLLHRLNMRDGRRIFGPVSPLKMLRDSFAVTVREQDRSWGEVVGRAHDKLGRVPTALRLLKPGGPGLAEGAAYQAGVRESLSQFNLSDMNEPLSLTLFSRSRHSLRRPEVSKFKKLYDGLSRPNASKGRARVAISRFNSAHGRSADEDRFIDTWIALEALFSPTDKQEVRYRVALRATHFIAKWAEEREEIYRTLLSSYDLRSQVVHGSKLTIRRPKNLNLSGQETLSRTQDYLRRALLKVVQAQEPLEELALDMAIARGN